MVAPFDGAAQRGGTAVLDLARKILADRRKNGRIDLEAVEMLVRESMHHAGATALSHLLNQGPPESPAIPCSCGHSARYKELRSKPVLTVVGPVEYQRPYYVCPQCHHAPNPTDAALGVERQEFSPGVRRMMAVVGSDAAFEAGREQLELLAGLTVSTKSVERQADAPGANTVAYGGTNASSIHAAGAICGSYQDAKGVQRGFLRAASGIWFSNFNARGVRDRPGGLSYLQAKLAESLESPEPL